MFRLLALFATILFFIALVGCPSDDVDTDAAVDASVDVVAETSPEASPEEASIPEDGDVVDHEPPEEDTGVVPDTTSPPEDMAPEASSDAAGDAE